jgi:hypothetical protein
MQSAVWNNRASNSSALKLLELFDSSNFDISAPHCSTHYTPDGKNDVLDIRTFESKVTVTDILDSDYLPIMISILEPVRKREALDPVEKLDRLGAVSKPIKNEGKLRKLWRETRNSECKMAVNWVTRKVRRMVRRRALERRETKLVNCEVTSQAIWLITKSLSEKSGPKAPSVIVQSTYRRYPYGT